MQLASLSRHNLATLPTPLERARRLEQELGPGSPRIYLKRDDLTGLAFGGNKARKLEFLLADALEKRATVLVSEGAAQSNHARITAAAAARAGLRCVLVLDSRHGADDVGNLFLDRLMGAEVRIVPGKPERKAEMARVAEELLAAGEIPYVIPTGGSVPLGAAAYVAAVAEMLEQLKRIRDRPSRIYLASGSLGTQAGLVVGARVFSAPFSVYGVAVDVTKERLVAEGVALANATATLLGLEEQFSERNICIDGDYIGPGYGLPTPEGIEAIRLLARTEAVFLDPVYSGKAMAALIAHVRNGDLDPAGAVLFLHTGGGPSIFPFAKLLLEG